MRLILIALFAGLLTACATPLSRIERNPQAFAQLPADQQERVKLGEVGVGFDETATRLAVGEPDRISQRETAEGRVRVWIYYTQYSNVTPGFCNGFYNGFASHRGYYYQPNRFGFNTCFYNETVLEEAMRVSFKDGKVTAVERMVR